MEGYKLLYKDGVNAYGLVMEEGKTYEVSGKVKFGLNGVGYHFCKNFEDCFKYGYRSRDIKIAKVIGSGEIEESYDHYNGFYDLFVASSIKIVSILTQQEIIEQALKLNPMSLERFLKLYPLTEEEKKQFIPIVENNFSLYRVFEYYQNNNIHIYDNPYNNVNVKRYTNKKV